MWIDLGQIDRGRVPAPVPDLVASYFDLVEIDPKGFGLAEIRYRL